MMSRSLRYVMRQSLKRLLIHAGLEVASFPGAKNLASSASGRGLIFTLHHVRPDRGYRFEPNAHLSVTPKFLQKALRFVREAGLHPVHLDDLIGHLADPSDERRFVCFTLDDGYRDNQRFAAPLFREYDVPFTIFITPGFVERTRTMWWETAEELIRCVDGFEFDFGQGVERVSTASRVEKLIAFERLANFVASIDEVDAVARINALARSAGIDPEAIVEREIMTASELKTLVSDPLARLGAHTMTHPNLARVDESNLKQEIDLSADRVAGYAGRAPKAFCYPYGGPHAAGAREATAAKNSGFALGVTTRPGVLSASCVRDPMLLPRVSLNGLFQKARYLRAFESGLPFKFV